MKNMFLRIFLALALTLVYPASVASAASVPPTLRTDLPNDNAGQYLGCDFELKVEPVVDGTYTDGFLTVTIDVHDTDQGQVFDWSSDVSIDAVVVKGGPYANVYQYDPPNESYGDTELHAPLNESNNKWYGLSHVTFCYDVEVDARLTLTPSQDANHVGTDHVITATLQFDYGDGYGFVPAPEGEVINFATDGPGSLSSATGTTDANGQCTVTLTSDTTGLTTISASWSGTIVTAEGEASASANADPVTKVWVAASLSWFKEDTNGELLGGATFLVCRIEDRFGNPIVDECITVLDNSGLDADPDDGEFLLTGLKLGKYTVEEIAAPVGYWVDPTVVTVDATLENPDVEITYVWMNAPWRTQLTPTGTECCDFVGETATYLETVTFGKSGKTSPGAFIFFTLFDSPDTEFHIDVTQSNDSGVPLFRVIEAKLFTGDCLNISNMDGVSIVINESTGSVQYVISADVAATYGDLVTYVKYGHTVDKAQEATYTFTTAPSTGGYATDTLQVIPK